MPYGVAVQPDEEATPVSKARLRATLLAARRARPEPDRQAARNAMSTHLPTALAGMSCVAAYLPLPTEPLDARTLGLLSATARVLVPVVTGAAPLDWCAYEASPPRSRPQSSAQSTRRPPAEKGVRRGSLGIDEPTGPRLGAAAIADADAILVPALAVDRLGHRLGRGGGHYDRTLDLLTRLAGDRPLAPRIALIYDDELLDAVPFDHLDQLVTAVLTPGRGLSAVG